MINLDEVTVTICIGNTDNKLSQFEWSRFISTIDHAISCYPMQIHFRGFTASDSQYQNGCWVLVGSAIGIESLKKNLAHLSKAFKQDSMAFVTGMTELI